MTSRYIGWGALLVALSAVASGQIPFQLIATQQGQSASNIANGTTVTMDAALGGTQSVQIVATYTGTGQAVFSLPPTVYGSTAFTASLSGTLPITLTQGQTATMTVVFAPASATQSSATVNLPYVETLPDKTTNTGAINVGFVGTAPTFSLSYVLQGVQNVVAVQPGGTVSLPDTLVGTTAQAAINITNTGSGTGTVTGISISGDRFKLQNTPLFPYPITAGQSLPVLVLYTPTAAAMDSGQVIISFSSGSPVTLNLSGNGITPSFTYQILSSPPATVSPGGTIAFPDTDVGQTSSLTVRILNSGNATGTVTSVSLSGQGFQLGAGLVLPKTLDPGSSVTFTMSFTPAQPGTLSGTLIVNSDTFTVSGTGLGSQLVFSYLAGGSTVTLSGTNNSVVFSPVEITQSGQLVVDVKNTGTQAATISSIGVSPVNGPYTLDGIPPLPVKLAPNADFQLTVTFTPTALGFSNGSLLVDTTAIQLVGSGTAPPPLPSYTISGPTGNATPMSQPAVALTLASPYPVAISGTLTLSVAHTLPADPVVQFLTGGATASFVIPANQTSAVFGAQGTQLGLQTGTVAGTITVTPSFETQAGSVSLTPASPTVLQFSVAPAAPQLVALSLSSASAASLSLQITGFSTNRTLQSAAVSFTTAPKFSMPSSSFTIDLTQVSTVWFNGTASDTFGGQFTITIPFTFQGLSTSQSVADAITSVSVKLNNALGASNTLQASFQ